MKTLTITFRSIDYYVAKTEVPDDFDHENTEAIHTLISDRNLDSDEHMRIDKGGIVVDEISTSAMTTPLIFHLEACQRCRRAIGEED
jgi:hypothetical protein